MYRDIVYNVRAVATALALIVFTITPTAQNASYTGITAIDEHRLFSPHPGKTILFLSPGWNLLSIPVVLYNTSITYVLKPIEGSYDTVLYFDSSETVDNWKVFKPGKPLGNTLNRIDHKMGFWIYITKNATLSYNGTIPTSTVIALKAGWNLIGYPSIKNRTVSELFFNCPMNLDYEVYRFDSNSPHSLKRMSRTGEVLSMGMGYWVRVTNECSLTIHWS